MVNIYSMFTTIQLKFNNIFNKIVSYTGTVYDDYVEGVQNSLDYEEKVEKELKMSEDGINKSFS